MINVIGLGYIGLPTALMMASHGVEVVGTDYNKKLVDTLRSMNKMKVFPNLETISLNHRTNEIVHSTRAYS